MPLSPGRRLQRRKTGCTVHVMFIKNAPFRDNLSVFQFSFCELTEYNHPEHNIISASNYTAQTSERMATWLLQCCMTALLCLPPGLQCRVLRGQGLTQTTHSCDSTTSAGQVWEVEAGCGDILEHCLIAQKQIQPVRGLATFVATP